MLKKTIKFQFTEVQIQLLFFTLFIIIGTFYANWIYSKGGDQYKIIFEFFYNRFQNQTIIKTDLLQYLVFQRLKLLIVLWLLGFVLFTPWINHIITSFFGFCFGLIFSAAVIEGGMSGYGFVFILLIPHGIIYITLYIYLIIKNSYFSKMLYKNRKTMKTRMSSSVLLEYFLVLAICSVFLMIGIFLEAYVNTDLVKWYISLNLL